MMFWIIFLSSSFSKHWHDNCLISLDSKIFYLFCDIGYSRKWCFESLPCNLQKYFTFSTQHAVTCCLWEWWHFYSCSSLWGQSPLKNACKYHCANPFVSGDKQVATPFPAGHCLHPKLESLMFFVLYI